MALELQAVSKEKNTETYEYLTTYLGKAVVEMQKQSNGDAKRTAKQKAEDVRPEMFSGKEINEMQQNLKKAEKNYGLQEKMYYHADGHYVDQKADEAVFRNLTGALATTVLATSAAFIGSAEGAVASMAVGAAITVGAATMRYLGRPENAEEKKKADEYRIIKHSQLALKQLKKAVEAPAKAAKKEAYKAQVADLYARTTLGQVGMRVDSVKAETKPEDKAANDAKKAEKAAKKEAYKNEVNKLYATTMPGVIGKFGGGR